MQAVAAHMTQRTGQYSPQSLSNVLWAFATQETHPGTPALDAAALLVCKSLQVSRSCAQILCSCSSMATLLCGLLPRHCKHSPVPVHVQLLYWRECPCAFLVCKSSVAALLFLPVPLNG